MDIQDMDFQSAPAEVLYKTFGFTVDNVIKRAKALLKNGPDTQ